MNGTNLTEYIFMVRNGDKAAFTQIYNDLKTPVYTIILRIVQSVDVAEEVTQDVFVKLFTSPPNSSVRNPRAWIFRMARNLAIDALRKRKRTDIDDESLEDADRYESIISRIDIEKAMARLPEQEREIVSLHLTAELTFGEIAGIVGLSVPSTYRRYRSAIKTLRDKLNGGLL